MGIIELLSEENKVLKKELDDYRKNEELFQALIETAVGDIGEDFFNNIVKKLSEWLNAECVIIGQLVSENIVEGFPMYLDGKLINGFTYSLKGTPCDLTSRKGYCVYANNVIDAFPNSKGLIEINAKSYVGTALYNKEGGVYGILCAISRNELNLPPQSEAILRIVGARITSEIERIKAKKALEISEENLKKANLSKDRFFSIISHDLRSPFNALIGFSKILMSRIEELDMVKTKKYINIIHEVSTQTYNLVTNLLDWTLTQTNDIQFNPGEFNLLKLIYETANSQKHLAQLKKIALNVSVDPDIKVFADSNMFATILRNLISNAIKFTSPGGEINVSAVSDSNTTIITVSDTGVGIKPSHLKKLFKSDCLFTSDGTDDEKGAGLGLNLCKELVKKHGGDIWVSSEVGHGTKFYFTIPVHKDFQQ